MELSVAFANGEIRAIFAISLFLSSFNLKQVYFQNMRANVFEHLIITYTTLRLVE